MMACSQTQSLKLRSPDAQLRLAGHSATAPRTPEFLIHCDLDGRLAVRALALETLAASLSFSEHSHQHRPEYPVLLAVDQQLGEGAALWVAQNSPIRSARSKSGSMRTWSSSARAADVGGEAHVHALLCRAR
jgi:hypothetical protein